MEFVFVRDKFGYFGFVVLESTIASKPGVVFRQFMDLIIFKQVDGVFGMPDRIELFSKIAAVAFAFAS
jgi:hypothetical protein